jgi:hypothetical protein
MNRTIVYNLCIFQGSTDYIFCRDGHCQFVTQVFIFVKVEMYVDTYVSVYIHCSVVKLED